MSISVDSHVTDQVEAVDAKVEDNVLSIMLSDGREIRLTLGQFEWLQWLADASAEQQANWSIEPGAYAIYWEDLDDGVEIGHLLSMQSLV